MRPSLDIIAVSGKAWAGKDHVFDNYLKPLGYHRFALADHFKITAVGRGEATYEEVFVTKPPPVRAALQRIGTEEGRLVYGEDVWCNITLAWMEHFAKNWGITKYCITDVRFPSEVAFVHRHGGRVLRIEAPTRSAASPLTPGQRIHESETALDGFTGFDAVISNEPGEEWQVEGRVREALFGNRVDGKSIWDTLAEIYRTGAQDRINGMRMGPRELAFFRTVVAPMASVVSGFDGRRAA
jgi:hypothetical protein